jgi:hypothetical protein
LEELQLMRNNQVFSYSYEVKGGLYRREYSAFLRDQSGPWYTSAIAGSCFRGRGSGSATCGQREPDRHDGATRLVFRAASASGNAAKRNWPRAPPAAIPNPRFHMLFVLGAVAYEISFSIRHFSTLD